MYSIPEGDHKDQDLSSSWDWKVER